MALLSLTGIEAGNWTLLADSESPEEGATVIVPLARLQENGATLFENNPLGALVPTDTPFSALEPLLEKLAFVAITFPAFGDGRGFSLAVRLRKDLGFKGEIRAEGPVIPDQALFLLRAGFDTVNIEDDTRLPAFEAALGRYKEFYQTDFTGATSIAHARHAKRSERIAS